jgi:hypothetical protein
MKEIKKTYLKVIGALFLPILYLICLYIHIVKDIQWMLYPTVIVLGLIIAVCFKFIYYIFYGDTL